MEEKKCKKEKKEKKGKKDKKEKTEENENGNEEKKEIKLIGKKRNLPKEEIDSQEENLIKKDEINPILQKKLQEMEQRNKKFIEKCESHPIEFIPPETHEVHPDTKALKFEIIATFNRARAGILTLPHGKVLTPVYMPVGTKAAMKGLLSADLERMGCKLMLSNTYHLGFEPGGDFLKKNFGGEDNRSVHHYMHWKNNLLTDSGGFQIASLEKLSERSEQGVDFISHITGDDTHLMLTPEKSMEIQNDLGSDIIMALDDVISPFSKGGAIYDSCERSLRWLDRCIKAHKRKDEQNLYGIVQGGINIELRKKACIEWTKRNCPGYAIGGMSGGESKKEFCDTIDICGEMLPKNKPRYLMGIGYPVDLVICALFGVDQFDCVFATRTARFGTAITDYGFLKLKSEKNKYDFGPIDKTCKCEVCVKYSRSYLYFLLNNNPRAVELISFHNVYYLLNLMKKLREAIINSKVNEFVEDFIKKQYDETKEVPDWVVNALTKAGCDTSFIWKGKGDKSYVE
jgi:queuine tRNA-ribosyltransferase